MTEKQMTTTEFSKFIHHISGYNNNIQNVVSMLRTNRAFFIRFYSTELSYVMQNKESTYFNETFIRHVESAVDFIFGAISQDPRFDVFYTKHQFGQHLFETKYNQTLDKSIQPFVTINYNRLADSEFANNPNVYYLYPKENCEDPRIILVLKNEYHDYYDQLN